MRLQSNAHARSRHQTSLRQVITVQTMPLCEFVTLSPVLAFYRGVQVQGFFVCGLEIEEKH